MLPLAAVGAGVAAGGLLSSISNRKRQTPGVDAGRLNGIVDTGTDQDRTMINSLRPRLQPLTDNYENNVNSAVDKTAGARADMNNAFLSSLRDKRGQMAEQDMGQASQRILQGVKPAQDQIREVLSGSGVGLQGGAAVKALSAPVLDANKQIGQYASDLDLKNREAEISAMDKINTGDNDFALQKLGIDKDTYATVMNSGRQDLIDEMNSLLEENRQSTSDKLGIEQLRQTGETARSQADNADRTAFNNSLISTGTSLLGYGLNKPKTGTTLTPEQIAQISALFK